MAGGPVQIVMNPDWFRGDRDGRRGGGAAKDFFRGDDRGFAEHRTAIVGALRSILRNNLASDRVNVAVRMRPDALAKSHRPFGTLFRSSRASHVGTGDYGELVFAITPTKLEEVIDLVADAEVEERWRPDASGALVYSPSPPRTEVSAIQDVREWAPAEERGYTLDEADAWLTIDGAAKAQVELFDLPEREPLRSATLAEVGALTARLRELQTTFTIAPPPAIEASVRRALEASPPGPSDVAHHPPATVPFREGLAEFEASSSVKRVRLEDRVPPSTEAPAASTGEESAARTPDPASVRPVVGVIDGGIGGPFINSAWVAGRADFLAPGDRDVSRVNHGTTIASLIALGSAFNSGILDPDEDCRVYDLDLLPAGSAYDNYYASLEDFLDEVRASVARAKQEAGVRVFNLSYNLRRAPGGAPYSLAAQGLDRIALDLDVLFVISAGNLTETEQREEWPPNSTEVNAMLARHSGPDGLLAPAESLVNVSVGATNPPGLAQGVEGVPARYTRRSDQTPSALKPDFAAYGGGGPEGPARATGLTAISSFGTIRDVAGTSYAAPLVARYLATLDAAISGDVSRDLLIALATHSARLPATLLAKEVAVVAPSFVGRGHLPTVAETLEGEPHRMTIVLSDTIQPGRNVKFPFRWPDSLSDTNGKCRGLLKLTLVTEPIINYAHGVEMVRVNLDGAVKQSDENGVFESRAQPTHEFFSGYRYANERTLASVLGKWYPVKSYTARMPNGRGKSTDWRLDLEYLTRAAESFPAEGVRFAAVLTIEDLRGAAPVYDEMRASLSEIGVTLSDLRTAVNVGVRA
ncbi:MULTISPECIES: S8 family serine peptidase [Microbacterium]|uniref:S8 family serine peptidase n=1 Tax=Microbacterium TaxID=33882 RepID=UPI0003DE5403|nr:MULTISPECIES: S8 family serine peptidase [Microbacterium]CDK01836.1 conserved hypothetical protein [Microbacterium sp. C448]